MSAYYIRTRGQVRGPFTTTQLHQLALRGKFAKHYQVSLDTVEWESAADHPELFPEVPQRPPPLRPQPAPAVTHPAVNDDDDYPVDEEDEEFILQDEDIIADSSEGDLVPPDVPREDWFYSSNGEQLGPVAMDELSMLAANGTLKPTDHLWTERLGNWVPASEVEGLFPTAETGSRASIVTAGSLRLPRTSPLATASFLLGLLGTSLLLFLGSILAVVFGHLALKEIRASENQLGGKGMAVAGLILGYTVLILGLIVGLVFLVLYLVGGTSS